MPDFFKCFGDIQKYASNFKRWAAKKWCINNMDYWEKLIYSQDSDNVNLDWLELRRLLVVGNLDIELNSNFSEIGQRDTGLLLLSVCHLYYEQDNIGFIPSIRINVIISVIDKEYNWNIIDKVLTINWLYSFIILNENIIVSISFIDIEKFSNFQYIFIVELKKVLQLEDIQKNRNNTVIN